MCSLQLRESINTLPQQAGSQLNPVIPQRPTGKHSNVTTDLSASRNKTPRVQVFLEQPQPSPFIHRHAIVHTSNATQYSVTESKPDSDEITFARTAAAAAAKLLQSCPILCDPIDSSPPGSPIPGILQAPSYTVGGNAN